MRAFYLSCLLMLAAGLPVTGLAANRPPPAVAAEVLRKEQALREATVEAALASLRAQVASSDLLRRYAITSNDIDRIASSETYTKVQRERAFQALWSRAKPDPENPNLRWFFLPFPSGLKYVIEDVSRDKSGCYEIALNALEKNNWQTKDMEGAYPDKTLEQIETAILPGRVHLRQLRIITEPHAAAAETLRKRQVVESGNWVIPVAVKSAGYIDVENPLRIYVKDSEHLRDAPELFGPGKPLQERPEPVAAGTVRDETNSVVVDVTLGAPLKPGAETGHFLSDWYLDYRRKTEAAGRQKKRTEDEWALMDLRFNDVEGELVMEGRTGTGGMPEWSHAWDVTVDGERHLLLTRRALPPGPGPQKMRVLVARALEEFIDEKGLQRTPLVLADLDRDSTNQVRAVSR